jgi:hypothetical protein
MHNSTLLSNKTLSDFNFKNLSFILNELKKNLTIRKNYLNKVDQFEPLHTLIEDYEPEMGIKIASIFGLLVIIKFRLYKYTKTNKLLKILDYLCSIDASLVLYYRLYEKER